MQIVDYSDALKLWQSLPGLGLSGSDEENQIKLFLEKNADTCFVAVDKNQVIGTVLGGSDGRRGYLYHLAVDYAHQKQGLGGQLVKKCLSALKKAGIQKCHIFVISTNQEGFEFWNRAGWLLRNDIVVMSMDL